MAKSTTQGAGVKTRSFWLTGSILSLSVACSESKHVSEQTEAEPQPRAAPTVATPARDPVPVNVGPSSPLEPPAPTFELTEKERMIVRQMLAEDFAGFGKGWDTLFGESEAAKEYVVASADDLQSEYERNEVAGDKKYRGKRLALRGKVAEIKRSIGENYFLTLKGGTNQFMHPTAKMAEGYIDYLAGLNKGQSIQIFCKGDGMLMGSAMVTECIPADTWIERMVSAKMLKIPEPVGADNGSTMLLIFSVVAAEQLKETSPCFSEETMLGDDRCQKDISQLSEKVKAKKGKSGSKLSEATQARLKAIPGADAHLQKMAAKAE
jgi:hypothetical protein